MRTGRPYRAVSSTEEGGEEEPAGMERWLLTYSDMITLLLALFVVLYALGSLNHVKYSEFAKGMNVSFNNGDSQPSSARTQPSKHPGDNAVEKSAASLGTVEAQLRGALIKAGLMKDVDLTAGPGGLVVGLITGKTYYGVDSAALSPLGAEVVDITGASHPLAHEPGQCRGLHRQRADHGRSLPGQLAALRRTSRRRGRTPAGRRPRQPGSAVHRRLRPVPPDRAQHLDGEPGQEPPGQHRHHGAGPESSPAMTVVRDHDFHRTETLDRQYVPALNAALDTFARHGTVELSTSLRRTTQLGVSSLARCRGVRSRRSSANGPTWRRSTSSL